MVPLATKAGERPSTARSGDFYALLSFGAWGLVPLYWRTLRGIDAVEVVAHRVVWSMAVLALLVKGLGLGGELRETLRSLARMRALVVSACLITLNWIIFIWAVQNGHVLDVSLGYFVNPLVNVAIGVVMLRERLRVAQGVSIAFALVGVIVLIVAARALPSIALALALSFALYGLVRKLSPVSSVVGLTVETLLFLPAALAFLAFRTAAGTSVFVARSPWVVLLLALSGPVSAFPLVWFAAAARRLSLSALGLFQYVSPSLQFVLAVAVFGEPLRAGQLGAFASIWAGLALFTWDRLRSQALAHAHPAAQAKG